MADKYAAETGSPTSSQCGTNSLLFDGYYLKLLRLGRVVQAWHARSGHAVGGFFDYSLTRQKVANDGPIPEGEYWIQPKQLDDLWMTSDGWGKARITIHHPKTTVTHARGGFFVHGGKVFGSAGCIDLSYGMDSFAGLLPTLAPYVGTWPFGGQSDCYIPLRVTYATLKIGYP